MDEIAGAIYQLALDEYNIPLVDRRVRFQTSAIANARGWMFDSNHPNEAGQVQKALDIRDAILWAMRL